MMTLIKFGTDGWRGLIAQDFTFENVALVATAVARVIKRIQPKDNLMIVGYDRRFLSADFAKTTAYIYAKEGFQVELTDNYVPTPALSWTVKNTPNCAGGTMITASHNPYDWNGFKFKEKFGGSASSEMTKLFEQEIEKMEDFSHSQLFENEFQIFCKKKKIVYRNFMEKYFDAVISFVDADAIRKKNFHIGLDTMYGAGSSHYQKLLESLNVKFEALHSDENPTFGHTPPEPVEKNLSELSQLVREKKLACGLATDGDADRLGAMDEHGEAFTTQKILSVVYWHMLKHRKKPWNISRSASTTRMVDLIAEKSGFQCTETPVGFKNIAQVMLQGKAQMGGEESGGIGFVDHVIERDGLLTGILLLEIMAVTGRTLSEIYAQLCKDIRPYEFIRLDLVVQKEIMIRAMEKLSQDTPKEWMKKKVERLQTIDGFKFYLEDGSWLLIRPSGTEPLFRLYAEAESLNASQSLLDEARNYVMNA